MDKDIEERLRERIDYEYKKFIDAAFEDFMKQEEEAQKVMKAAYVLTDQFPFSLEEAMGAIMNAIMNAIMGGYEADGMEEEQGPFLNIKTAWDRKEEREKQRASEREAAARFRQQKANERAWTTRKRTRPRGREWRGAWKER